MKTKNEDYIINNFGAKVLLKYTNSFATYSAESTNLEMFLTYLLLAEHNDKDNIKDMLTEIYCNGQDNIISDRIKTFINSEKGDEIFNIENYEVYFGQMAYTRLTDNALCYFKDVLSEVVKKKPEVLRSSEKESFEYILSFNNMEDLITDLSDRKIKQLFYGSIIDIKKFFKDKLGVNLFEDENVEKNFSQLVKQRNLIVHNRGIISEEFSKEFPDFTVGNILHFKYKNLSLINVAICNVIANIDIQLREKFELVTIHIGDS